jgi:predicted regulator of Ras-like GTPase activity (Roadblock/LC7/MglB family)
MRPDAIGRWSEELARDPRSLAFLPLGEELRRRRRLDDARRVALRGLERHPYRPDAHDLLARICADLGDDQRARDEWEMALEIDPGHLPSLKGLGFLAWRRRDLAGAERYLRTAREKDPYDTGVETALGRVREVLQAPPAPDATPPQDRGGAPARGNGGGAPRVAAAPAPAEAPAVTPNLPPAAPETDGDARTLFEPLLRDGDCTALLLDRDGLVLAGAYEDESGSDVGDAVGAVLSGVGEEAARALEHLKLGEWESLLVEAPYANVTLGPVRDGAVVMVAAGADARVGFVRRLFEGARRRAASWLEGS